MDEIRAENEFLKRQVSALEAQVESQRQKILRLQERNDKALRLFGEEKYKRYRLEGIVEGKGLSGKKSGNEGALKK